MKLLRAFRLIKTADTVRFYLILLKTRKERAEFKKANPTVVLPPNFYMYETFGLSYNAYYNNGRKTAEWLASYFKKYKNNSEMNILDWGCGPGRIIRHISDFMDNSKCYGSDYNKRYVKWCSDNIKSAQFVFNELTPPLQFEDNMFDIIYGISIFTHLSEEMHYAWFNEHMRVLKPGGILFITLHGKAFKKKLNEQENKLFDSGKLVIQSGTMEGHRTYAAYQPVEFVHKMVGSNKVLEHVEASTTDETIKQDIWIVQKL